MNEIYIAKGNNDTLTRVSLEINNEKYIVETPYSDSNTIELLIKCMEGYCLSNGYTRNDIIDTMGYIINEKPYNNINYVKDAVVKTTIEQYDDRFITIKEGGINIIRAILDSIISATVQSSWSIECILDYFQLYIDEFDNRVSDTNDDEEDNNDI